MKVQRQVKAIKALKSLFRVNLCAEQAERKNGAGPSDRV
jgi:hypothetical protein